MIAVATEDPVEEMKNWLGFQPISKVLRIAMALNFGTPVMNKTSTLLSRSVRIWESTVGSETS